MDPVREFLRGAVPVPHRMESAGFLPSTERPVDGRVRRAYVITDAGREALRQLRAVVTEMASAVLHPSEGEDTE